jgi:D-Tyr-tRNAtyr deacylase
MLNASGFNVKSELYRASVNASVAQGIYYIEPSVHMSDQIKSETELGMMFGWTNSYNKTIRFQCAIGGYVMVCNNGMVSGDMMNFARKHTGSADYEVKMQISNQIKNAEKYYQKILDDRDSLRQVVLSNKQQAELLGRLYVDKEILDVSQITTVKSEMKDPSYDYNCDADNAWAFYNHVTHALKKSHPRSWLSDTQKFHDFMVVDVLGQMGIKPQDTVQPIDPGQFGLFDVAKEEEIEVKVEDYSFTL